MNGYIVVADDLLFDNQPVAVGETITVTRHPKSEQSPTVRKMVLSFVRPQDVEQLKNDSIRAIRVTADKATIVE